MNSKSVMTLTYGDRAEAHVGMEIHGVGAVEGYSVDEVHDFHRHLKHEYDINSTIEMMEHLDQHAALLIIPNGVDQILAQCSKSGFTYQDLYNEQLALEPLYDRHALMKGRVVNKHARWNTVFDDISAEPDYINAKSRVTAFNDVRVTSELRHVWSQLFGSKAKNLKCEGNYYYDPSKCGIGYHGDTERKIVIGIRLGATMPLCFAWYHRFQQVGYTYRYELNGGDIYVMSEKAVGHDWRKSSQYTLRHAAGCDKYTQHQKLINKKRCINEM